MGIILYNNVKNAALSVAKVGKYLLLNRIIPGTPGIPTHKFDYVFCIFDQMRLVLLDKPVCPQRHGITNSTWHRCDIPVEVIGELGGDN